MGYLTKLGRHILLIILSFATCNAELAGSERPQKNPSSSSIHAKEEDAGSSHTEHHKSTHNDTDGNINQQSQQSQQQQQQFQSHDDQNSSFSKRTHSSFRQFTARSFSVDPEVPNQVLVVLYVSLLYDLLDVINVIVDAIVIIRLFQMDEGNYIYPSLLLTGLLLGRIVDYRGSQLLFRYGVEWYPFWIKTSPSAHGSPQSRKALSILYCLLFTEAAIFLLEDYPSLVVYDHWMVVGFPPPELEYMDNLNVAMSAASMFILWALFGVALSVALYRLVHYEWATWATTTRLWNLSKILVFGAAVFFLARYVIQMLLSAITLVLDREQSLPSNTFFGVTLCEPPATFDDRQDYCHEQIFILQVLAAWFAAAVFAAYLIFRPAVAEIPMDQPEVQGDVSGAHSHSSDLPKTSEGGGGSTTHRLDNPQDSSYPDYEDTNGKEVTMEYFHGYTTDRETVEHV